MTIQESIVQATTRGDSVDAFLDCLEAHRAKTDETIALVEQVYRFETPDRPVLEYAPTGHTYERSGWVRTKLDGMLDRTMQWNCFNLEVLPQSDFVPVLTGLWGGSHLISRMLGADIDLIEGGGVLANINLIGDLERDLPLLPNPDPSETPEGLQVLRAARFFAEETGGKVQIAYPQMQGPLTNAARMMDQAEMLMACYEAKDAMREFVNRMWGLATRFQVALQDAVGPDLLQPRARFYQPNWVRAVIVGDYLTIMQPEDYYYICADAWRHMYETVGPIFYHTCGPVWRSADVMAELPGLVGFETVFVTDRSKTTRELEELKAKLHGRLVVHSCELPFFEPVSDPENLTREWFERMNEGGGFYMHATGTVAEGKELFDRLGLL